MSKSASYTLDLPPGADCDTWCNTYMEIFRHKWTIHDFSKRPEQTGTYIESSTFVVHESDKIKWCLRFYPRGCDQVTKGNLSLFLHRKTSGRTQRVKYKFSILNAKQEEAEKQICSVVTFSPKTETLGFRKFIRRNDLMGKANSLLCDDKLTLYCEVEFPVDFNKENGEVPVYQLSEDFEKLLQSKDFSDVILDAKGREFHVHKCILSARSPVFAAMFKHEVKETIQNRVEITDIDPEVLEELLRFVYTGKSHHLEKMADALFAAANKYALEKLKALCEEVLTSRLSVENVLDVLVSADMHNANRLKADAMNFVTLHAVDVIRTAGWKTLKANKPYLITEICEALVTKNISNLLKPY